MADYAAHELEAKKSAEHGDDMLHGLAFVLTRKASQVAMYGRQRNGLNHPFATLEADESQEVQQTPPI
jgi:hypothetical protein